MNKRGVICERHKKFGYTRERRMLLCGEDLRLVSNAMAEGNGYSVLDVALRSAIEGTWRVPLSVVSRWEREPESQEAAQLAA